MKEFEFLSDIKLDIDTKFKNISFAFIDLNYVELTLGSNKEFIGERQKSFATERLRKYIAGRVCAKKALHNIQPDLNFKLESGEAGNPLWPDGYCGAISHSKKIAGALVAQNELNGIGLDIEEIVSTEKFESLKNKILTSQEQTRVTDTKHFTLIFSAKESLYKMLYPLVKTYFGFMEAEVSKVTANDFEIELISKKPELVKFKQTYHGKYFVHQGQIFTYMYF